MHKKKRHNGGRNAQARSRTTRPMSDKKKSRKTYYDHAKEASKPISERKLTIEGRGGKRSVRRHHLDPKTQTELLKQMETSGQFLSPYKAFGGYWGATAALAKLGPNEFRSTAEIVKSFEAVMSDESSRDKAGRTAWERFKNKRPRSRKNGLDWFGRILQNLTVLQRIGGDDPYGLKLAQVGACIDLKHDEGGQTLVRLRTGIPKGQPVAPLNEIKQRNCVRSVESIPSQIVFTGKESAKRRAAKRAAPKSAPKATPAVPEAAPAPPATNTGSESSGPAVSGDQPPVA